MRCAGALQLQALLAGALLVAAATRTPSPSPGPGNGTRTRAKLGVRQEEEEVDPAIIREVFTSSPPPPPPPAVERYETTPGSGSVPGPGPGPGSDQEPLSQEFICSVFGGPSCPDSQPINVPCLCDSNEPCQCVPYYQCDKSTGSFNEFGVGVIDIRNQGNSTCPHYIYKCCKTATPSGSQHPQPLHPPYPDSETQPPYNPDSESHQEPEPHPHQEPEPHPHQEPEPHPSHPEPPYRPGPVPGRNPNRCGQRNPEGIGVRITGDENGEAQFGEFPWMVAVLKVEPGPGGSSDGERKRNLYQCGGALITPQIVLTAGHCVVSSKSTPEHLRIRAGEWDTQTNKEMYRHQDVTVADIEVHPDYYGGAVHFDVALLFLTDPVHVGYHIGTICMPEQDQNFDYQKCFVSGWGKDKFGQEGRYQVILKKLELPIVPHAQCQEALRSTRLGQYFRLHHTFICAGGEAGKDTCNGDGGSPLVCPMPSDPTRYQLAGAVAWGIDCGLPGIPGVYANIALFRNWVDEQLRAHHIDPAPYLP